MKNIIDTFIKILLIILRRKTLRKIFILILHDYEQISINTSLIEIQDKKMHRGICAKILCYESLYSDYQRLMSWMVNKYVPRGRKYICITPELYNTYYPNINMEELVANCIYPRIIVLKKIIKLLSF